MYLRIKNFSTNRCPFNSFFISKKKRRKSCIRIIRYTFNRRNYLRITDDFTIGYADVAGFRLGTCHAVKWINPKTKELTSLTLHPLTMMDSSLSDKRYMNLNAHEAYEYSIRLINMVESWNGELVLLWHNTSVEDTPRSYHRKLYLDIINYLKDK